MTAGNKKGGSNNARHPAASFLGAPFLQAFSHGILFGALPAFSRFSSPCGRSLLLVSTFPSPLAALFSALGLSPLHWPLRSPHWGFLLFTSRFTLHTLLVQAIGSPRCQTAQKGCAQGCPQPPSRKYVPRNMGKRRIAGQRKAGKQGCSGVHQEAGCVATKEGYKPSTPVSPSWTG